MGGKWSKNSIVGWPKIRERIRKAGTTEPAADGVGAASRDLEKHGHTGTRGQTPTDFWVVLQVSTS
uniref:Truncated Nef n=1 Tax=Human immunodeficiency virus type 1 TaxID=11676 RepID=A0A2S1WC19_HV1|nr:truncated Nef [Human immunodeficiency virus 1]